MILKMLQKIFLFYKINDPLIELVVRWRKERKCIKCHRWLDNSWGSCEKQRRKGKGTQRGIETKTII